MPITFANCGAATDTVRYPTTIDSSADDVFHGGDTTDDARPISPERALWLAVIARAWIDAFEASDWFLKASETKLKNADFDPELVRGESRRWLTLDFGTWFEDRETVCDLANISEPMLRNAARRKLAEVKKAETENRVAEVISLDTAFARLLDNEATMSPDALDAALEALAETEQAA